MNRDYVVWHLEEAAVELNRTIREMQSDADYSWEEFAVAMQHLYNHVNTAWNARDASAERAQACSKTDFYAWRQFPTDIDMGE